MSSITVCQTIGSKRVPTARHAARTAQVLRNNLQRCSVLGCGAAVLHCSHLLARNTARITLKHRELPVHTKSERVLAY